MAVFVLDWHVKPRAMLCLGVLAGMLSTSAAAPVPDTIAQRVVACAACHGDAGRATRDGFFPRIAGKPAGYLYNQLINFREGRRRNPQMIYMVDHLSDAYLHEIADYFSNLHPPYALPQPILANTAALERGKQLALLGDQSKRVPACIACHGEKLTGTLPTIPGLLGLPRDYLNAQFGAWRTKTRRAAAPDCMAQIVSRLSDQDLSAAANWLAAQPIPVQPVAAPASSIVAKLPLTCGSFPQ